MELFNLQDIKKLEETKSAPCVSIFMTAHRNGHESLEGLDWREFKNCLKEAEDLLLDKGKRKDEINEMLNGPRQLLEDTEFWRHLSDGLAVFIAPGIFNYYSMPVAFDHQVYVQERFFLAPILPMLTAEKKFYILTVSFKQVGLYEATDTSIRKIHIEDIVPQSIAEVLIDREANHWEHMQHSREVHYPNKSRTRKERGESAVFHGHGGQKDLKENEQERFYADVSKALKQILHEEETPLIMAGVETVVAEFRKHYTYNNLVSEIIEGNMDEINPQMLYEKAWGEMEPYFKSEQWLAVGQYNELAGTGKASEDVKDIVKASMEGKVSTLLIEKNTEIWGKIHPSTYEVEVHNEFREGDISLLNKAAVQTVLNRGKVLILESDDMPETTTMKMAAIFRY